MDWVSRIMSMTVAMVGPILFGVWLDNKLHTPWFTPLMAIVGLVLGMTYLLALTTGRVRSSGRNDRHRRDRNATVTDSDREPGKRL